MCTSLGCRFQKYIDSYHRNSDPPDPSRFSTTTTREGDGWDEGSEDGDTDDLFSESYSEHTYDTGKGEMHTFLVPPYSVE